MLQHSPRFLASPRFFALPLIALVVIMALAQASKATRTADSQSAAPRVYRAVTCASPADAGLACAVADTAARHVR